MKFRSIALFFSLIFFCHADASQYVFFGDSLSDTSNFPEPGNINSPMLENINLYVPISNPVPQALYGQNGYPDQMFLQQSLPERGLINGQPKALYSINWPLYLVSGLQQPQLTSWYQYQLDATQPTTAINYAWASAIASGDAGCFHISGSAYAGECTGSSILAHRQTYIDETLKNPDPENQINELFAGLQIPNLAKQVSFYLNDPAVNSEKNTRIFIYAGNNDISNFLKSRFFQIVFDPRTLIHQFVEKEMAAISDSVVKVVETIQQHTSNAEIYVMTLADLANLSAGHLFTGQFLVGPKFKYVIDNAVSIYNTDLHCKLARFCRVHVVDSGKHLDQLAKDKIYSKSVSDGAACINDSSGSYTDPTITDNANCKYGDNQELRYFSWNGAHYVTDINKSLAEYVTSAMANSH